MDQKRTLWIVAAVGLFLLVVIGFAAIIYAPKASSSRPTNSLQSSNDIWTSAQNSDFIPIYPEKRAAAGTETDENFLPSDSMMLTEDADSKTADTKTADAKNADAKTADSAEMHVRDLTVISENTKFVSNGQTIDLTGIINTNQPTVNQNKVAETPAPKTVETKPVSRPVVKAAPAPAKPAAKAAPSSAKPAAKAATASAATQSVPKFWIQASSYSSKKNAEEARNALSAEKIPAEIFTYTDAKGALFYRVRVGPYSTKSEAEYWQTRIKSISKFANTQTYITNSTAKAK
ncbi:MAG: SPOR domain-containing protein [Treponemataceae bacterium]|nr:SPOR domain-containing protein [Treponemataceae bacterium]